MKYRVQVTIDGRDYTLTAGEDNGYIEQVAAYVDNQIGQVTGMMHVSAVDAATMAAMNIADSYFQERTAAENLRRQLKEALDENKNLERELSNQKMENFRLSQKR